VITSPAREHAIDAAKFIIRMRRIPTHAISFRTTHEGALAKLGPSDYIRVAMDETQYDEFNNGVVTADGALVSTKQLTDGSYNVIAWDGTEGTPPADATLDRERRRYAGNTNRRGIYRQAAQHASAHLPD
jgi:hypothetical protein